MAITYSGYGSLRFQCRGVYRIDDVVRFQLYILEQSPIGAYLRGRESVAKLVATGASYDHIQAQAFRNTGVEAR